MAAETFEDRLRELGGLGQRLNVLCAEITGFEMADERGWLDAASTTKLAACHSEFDTLHETFRQRHEELLAGHSARLAELAEARLRDAAAQVASLPEGSIARASLMTQIERWTAFAGELPSPPADYWLFGLSFGQTST